MRDRITWVDWLVAAIVGIVLWMALAVFSVSGVDPAAWESAAIAKGLLPVRTLFPGLWRVLPGVITPGLGAFGGGLLAFLVVMIIRIVFVILARPQEENARWSKLIAPAFAAAGGVFAVASDPIWRACQVFSPELYQLIFAAVIFLGFLLWLLRPSHGLLFPIVFVAGLFAAENVYGFLIPLFGILIYKLFRREVVNGVFRREREVPSSGRMPNWQMFFCFMAGLALGVYLNIELFLAGHGLEQAGWAKQDIVFHYGYGYLGQIASSATLVGWALMFAIGLLPFIAVIRLFPILCGDDRPIGFRLGVMMFFSAVIAFFQVSPVSIVWFWSWLSGASVIGNDFLLGVCSICAACAVVTAGATFSFDVSNRWLDCPDRPHLVLMVIPPIVVFVCLAFVLIEMPRPGVTAMQRLVDDAVAETVREAGDAEWIFTDGNLDTALELEAARQGKVLRPLNMMSGASSRDVYLRTRGFTDEDEVKAAKQGVPVVLRIWAGEREDGMDKAAIQLGFEFWRRAQKPLPPVSGLVARPKGMGEAEIAAGIKAADELSNRILEISKRDDLGGASPELRKAFADVTWRLSRFARLRKDNQLAEKLDSVNGLLKRMLDAFERERLRTFMQLTPREGLEIALKRADFIEARRYAAAVLKRNENDPEANFGIGMSYLLDNRYKDAEFYLRRCLKQRPEEPALLNNLAIIARKTGRYQEAVNLAEQAYKLLPNNSEVNITLKECKEALEKSRKKK